ncbi:YpzG family protein [Texcoconibacillus texcoconensis]|uniref:YpzG family protein n=1 Tax=Texcoconibacillus texcoconensis TaxID=1095777 RepID=A0A840QTJ2_9BACI|nr:YpzG family protein [Texcoconibacillus texcoconensis]MBB5174633.1 hypothetical protein [Texcoconibacillus texcoconensis]
MSKHPATTKGSRDPFQSPTANPKHAAHQINGESRMSRHTIVLKQDVKKRC